MKPVSLLFFFFFIIAMAKSATAKNFTCTTEATCQSLIGYVTVNTTTLLSLQKMFNIGSLTTLLAANSKPFSTSPNLTVQAGSTVRIPFPCRCMNGIGRSDGTPNYTVVPQDGLFHIATEVFSGFVTYPEIQFANNISNPDRILVDQTLWIPLPCSCDNVEGERAVHYGHKVVKNSTLESIAVEFGTREETLLKVNEIVDPTTLKEGDILDVPLRACASSFNSISPDTSLLVPNGTSALTANNCVQCRCNSTNLRMECVPFQVGEPLNQTQCSSMRCSGPGNYVIGDTISSSGCNRTACSYAGYNGTHILTEITNESICPGKSAAAPRLGSQWSSWMWLFFYVNICFLGSGFLL